MDLYIFLSNTLFATFITLILYYSLVKVIRTAILSSNRWLNLDDINILLFTSIFLTLIVYQPIESIKYAVFVLLLIYWLLLWIDAVIFYLFSFEINRQNISEFLSDYKSMLHYSLRSFELFKRYPWILLALPLSILSIYSSLFDTINSFAFGVILPFLLTTTIFFLQRFKQAITRNIIILSFVVITVIIISYRILPLLGSIESRLSVAMSLLIVISFLLLNIYRTKSGNIFFNLNSHFRKFLRNEKLVVDQSIEIKEEHKNLLNVPRNEFTPSKYFGLLKGSSVILITAESVGSTYLSDKMQLPFLSQLKRNSVSTNNHYALSPHTNQFLIHLFNSNYTPIDNHILHQYLIDANYSTSFISSANMNICESRELLEEIGYNRIIDRNDLYGINKNKGDYLLLDAIPHMEEILTDSPNFIQLLTVESHYPYDVVDKKRFDKNLYADLKTKYLNTIEETDLVLNKLFTTLSKNISLDDILIVYVGDHGESFGELGYKAHSNSTINAQLKVPFYMKHKALQPETIKFSTHFDIMPTILDLLGFKYNDSLIGNSIFCEDRKLPHLFYSMVKKGNIPANVRLKTGIENIMIDRVLDYKIVINEEDGISRHLSKNEMIYYNTLMLEILNNSNLVSS